MPMAYKSPTSGMDRMPQQFNVIAVKKCKAAALGLKNAERFVQRVSGLRHSVPQGFEIVDIARNEMNRPPLEQGYNLDSHIAAMDDRVNALGIQDFQGPRRRPNLPMSVAKNAYLHEAVSRS
jgi:hypothetical protein